MKKKIYRFISNYKKYVPILAKEIVETFQTDANKDNVEYSFTLDGTSKKVKGDEANTYFAFDTKGETCIDEFKKLLFDKDLEDIEKDSPEEVKLMEDVRIFLFKICQEITYKYKENLQETIRRVVLGDKHSSETVPLDNIEVISIDVADYSSVPESCKYLLRIGRVPGTEIDSDDVIKFVQNRQEVTGMDIDTVFSIEKQAGNPLFKNVMVIEATRKFLNEIIIYFFIDYSLSEEAKNKMEEETTKEMEENCQKTEEKTFKSENKYDRIDEAEG